MDHDHEYIEREHEAAHLRSELRRAGWHMRWIAKYLRDMGHFGAIADLYDGYADRAAVGADGKDWFRPRAKGE